MKQRKLLAISAQEKLPPKNFIPLAASLLPPETTLCTVDKETGLVRPVTSPPLTDKLSALNDVVNRLSHLPRHERVNIIQTLAVFYGS